MIWPYYIGLILVLAVPADRPHRIALGLVAMGLFVAAALGAILDNQSFYIAQCVVWIGIALSFLYIPSDNHWISLSISGILLVVAGISVLPAWLLGDALVPFASFSLVFSGVCGVGAIIALGTPGLSRATSWLLDLGKSLRNRRFRRRNLDPNSASLTRE